MLFPPLSVLCVPGGESNFTLPFFEDEERRQHYQSEANEVIPSEFFLQVKHRKKREDHQRYDLLDGFEFRRAELTVSHPVCRYLKNIFEERDAPTGEDHDPQRFILVL